MKKLMLSVALVLAGVVPASADETVRTLEEEFSLGEMESVYLQFPVGDLSVEATDGREVQVHVDFECKSSGKSRCSAGADQVRLVSKANGTRLVVGLEEWPKHKTRGLKVRARVQVPRDLPLSAKLDVGDLTISGLDGNVRANLDVGDVNVALLEASVASVSLDTGVGDATLITQGKSLRGSGFITENLHWKGPGKAKVQIDCGVGDIKVELK